jgi:hypothetical protein
LAQFCFSYPCCRIYYNPPWADFHHGNRQTDCRGRLGRRKNPRGRVGGPAPRVLWGSSQKSDLDFGDDNAPRRPPDRRLTSDKDGENRSGTGVDLHFVLAFLRFDQVHGPDRELSVPSRTVESTPACDRRQPIFRASTCPNCKVAKLLSTNALGGPRREY